MNKIAKLYYRAISYYYIANDSCSAIQECNKALDLSTHNEEITHFLRQIKKRKKTRMTSYQCQYFLEKITNDDIDGYLMLFLAEYDIDSLYLQKINWKMLDITSTIQHSAWCSILNQDWFVALELTKEQIKLVQGNPTIYFQYAIVQFYHKHFEEAEKYLFLLAKFGGIYTIAAINVLLKLSQKQFKTFAKHNLLKKYTQYLSSQIEYVYIGTILQKSWDEEAFCMYTTLLQKNANTTREYLDLACLYSNDGNWHKAIQCYRAIKELKAEEVKEIISLFQENHHISFSYKTKAFFSHLIDTINDFNALQIVCTYLENKEPKIALKGHQELAKKNKALGLLGQAICYYYLNKHKKATKFLKLLNKSFPEYQDHAEKWALFILAKKEAKKAIETLRDKTNKSPILLQAMEELLSTYCPICYEKIIKNNCISCNYKHLGFFHWKSNSLRLNNPRLIFPKDIALISTSASLYVVGNVHIIAFVTRKMTATISISKDDIIIYETSVEIEGIAIFEKKINIAGIYDVKIETKNSTSKQRFVVAQEDDEMNFQCISQKWSNKNMLEIIFTFSDSWKYQSDLIVELYDIKNSCSYLPKNIQKFTNTQKVTWEITKNLASNAYFLAKSQKKTWITSVQIREKPSWEELEKSLSLPLSTIKSNAIYRKNVLSISLPYIYEQVQVVTQPISIEPLQIYHYKQTEKIDIPLPSFINGAYLATTRFEKSNVQGLGSEAAFMLLRKPPLLHLIYPEEVEPKVKFNVDIKSDFNGKIHIFSQTNSFFSLKEALLDTRKKTIWPKIKQKDCTSNKSENSFLGTHEFKKNKQIEIQAPEKEGMYKYIFFASDNSFFIEKIINIKINKKVAIQCEFPKKIGKKDHLEISIFLKSKFVNNKYSIDWKQQGNIEKGAINENKTKIINISQSDTIIINLGEEKFQQIIEPLEIENNTSTMWQKVTTDSFQKSADKNYTATMRLHEIAKNITNSNLLNIENIAAKLYTLAILYLENADNEQAKWEDKILFWQTHLINATDHFQESLWAYAPKQKPNKYISIEILNHLAIFFEIPKFKKIVQQAQQLTNELLARKVKDNRLLVISLDFQEKIKTSLSAAGLILHDINVKKATKYLEKHAKVTDSGVHWEGKNIGEATTLYVAQALTRINHELAEKAISYIDCQWKNTSLGHSILDVAYLKLLRVMIKKNAHIKWSKTKYETKNFILNDTKKTNFSIKFKGNEILKQGDEFSLKVKIKNIKYPKIFILIPPHITIKTKQKNTKENTLHGYVIWPECQMNLEMNAKVLHKGVGTIHFVAEEIYNKKIRVFDSYQIVVS